MSAIEIEVMSQHYVGPLLVKPFGESNSQFLVYLQHELLGRVHPLRVNEQIHWYSHEITDKELVNQIGEWIEYHYPLSTISFQPVYPFTWRLLLPAASVLLLLLLG